MERFIIPSISPVFGSVRIHAAYETLQNFGVRNIVALQPGHIGYPKTAATRLIRVAGDFVACLRAERKHHQLINWANAFRRLTAVDSPFDMARQRAQGVVVSVGEDLLFEGDQLDFAEHRRRLRLYTKRKMAMSPRAFEVSEEGYRYIKDLRYIRWHLAGAYEYAELFRSIDALHHLVGHGSLVRDRHRKIARWQHHLERLCKQIPENQLFGCFVLDECYEALEQSETREWVMAQLEVCDMWLLEVAVTLAAEVLAGLAERMQESRKMATETEVEANESPRELTASLSRTADTQRDDSPDAVPSNNRTWYYKAHVEPFPEYAHGPLEGKGKDLAYAVSSGTRKHSDHRALAKKAESGLVWVRRVSGQEWQVFFKSERQFTTAKNRLDKLQEGT